MCAGVVVQGSDAVLRRCFPPQFKPERGVSCLWWVYGCVIFSVFCERGASICGGCLAAHTYTKVNNICSQVHPFDVGDVLQLASGDFVKVRGTLMMLLLLLLLMKEEK